MVETDTLGNHQGWKKRVDELIDKKLVKGESEAVLKKMIASPDKENFVLAQEILKSHMSDELIKGLNEGQTIAFSEIVNFFENPEEDAFVLKGYAGTGKTFLVKRILEYIAGSYPNRRIAITAPTNKAVQVLQEKAPFNSKKSEGTVFADLFNAESRIEYKTIHKLLGLKERITANGEQTFAPDGKKKSDLTKFKYLIVDEVSMLDDTLCKEILKQADRVKILFMGDPAQIPPINRVDCIPFRDDTEYKFKRYTLTEIMRQIGDHPVVDASFHLRNNLETAQPIPRLETMLNDEGNGVIFYDAAKDEQRALIRPLLNELFNTEEFKKDANHAKIISWTNKNVNYMNGLVREVLYGTDVDPFVVGEKLIASKPIFKKVLNGKFGPYWDIDLFTSQEMEVVEVEVKPCKFDDGGVTANLMCWVMKTKVYDPVDNQFYTKTIRVIHENEMRTYNELLKDAKSKAIRSKQKVDWVTYYNIMKWSADAAYNYAITAHKSQGSTYKNVLLMEHDIDHNRKVVERNRIKYTAYSRPTDRLYILRKNYK